MASSPKRGVGKLHLLTVREVQTAGSGALADGGGLELRVGAKSSSWVFRYTSPTGRRREMGVGPAFVGNPAQAGTGLTTARDIAHRALEQLRQGIDPLDDRDVKRETAKQAEQAKKAEQLREQCTLARWARDYHRRVIEPSRTPRHVATWIASLENHIAPALWNAPIDTIEPPALLAALLGVVPHERARAHKGDTLPETVQRIRQRLDAIYEDAIFHKRAAMNPAAAVKRKMREATGPRACELSCTALQGGTRLHGAPAGRRGRVGEVP